MKDKKLKPIANAVRADFISAHKGITLIALVITIIVMLILVGVSVSIAINGGLFSTAKKAVTKTEEAKDSELRFMAMANAATHNEKWEYTSKDNKTIPIPAGFAPTEIEGETSTDEGFVIIDAEGNEFVWIPCDDVNEYNNATFENNSDWSIYQYRYTGKSWTDGEENVEVNGEKKTVSAIKSESIKTNKGFYVARYEAGIPENAPFYASKDGDEYKLYAEKNTSKYTPVSKKGYPAWNYINQRKAKTISENMYSGMSYLIDSHAWNYICKNILEPKGKTKKDIINSSDWGNYYNNEATKYENLDVLYAVHESNDSRWNIADGDSSGTDSKYHKGLIPEGTAPRTEGNKYLELSTGASEDFKAYNIYDMAGNMWEWTTETSTEIVQNDKDEVKTTIYAVSRGGGFNANGDTCPIVRADGRDAVDICAVNNSFRIVLYL